MFRIPLFLILTVSAVFMFYSKFDIKPLSVLQSSDTIRNRSRDKIENILSKFVDETVRKAYQESKALLDSIRRNCEKHHKVTHWDWDSAWFKPRMLLMSHSQDLSHQLLYASNPKTGSTSFKKFLFLVDGDIAKVNVHNNPHRHYKIIEEKTDIRYKNKFDHLIKIGFIRNPLTRMLSAFRDKQLRHFKYLTPDLDYRANITDIDLFDMFIDEIISKNRWPTDIHLMPQWQNMKLCSWPYDFLFQYENIDSAVQTIQRLTNTTNVQYHGSRKETGSDTITSDDVARQYYSNLSADRMKVIYDKYDMDFKIIGYSKFQDISFPNITITN